MLQKSKGDKKSKAGKKGKKGADDSAKQDDGLSGEGSGLLELVEPEPQPPMTTFRTLAEDANLELVGVVK